MGSDLLNPRIMFLCRKLALYVQEMNGRGAGELSGNGGFGCFLVFSFFFFSKVARMCLSLYWVSLIGVG